MMCERVDASVALGPLIVPGTDKGLGVGCNSFVSAINARRNRSLSTPRIPAGKRFGSARDWTAIFAADGPFRAAETGFSRVSLAKAPRS
jgi:hypothetical protein